MCGVVLEILKSEMTGSAVKISGRVPIV